MSYPRVCYMGAYAPDYPRNLILRRGLALNGVEVIECNAPVKLSTIGRSRYLLREFPALASRCDTIILAEFCQALAPAAWILARRFKKRLIIDSFTSFYDSAVHDRANTRPYSLSALRYWLVDALALRLAHHLITDTRQHAAYFADAFRTPLQKITPIPVGASQEWFDLPSSNAAGETCTVQFFGTYIPLHGIETILHAAQLLSEHATIQFELIGRGQTYDAMHALADELSLTNTVFKEPVHPALLPDVVAQADISLGIFGTTAKASRVVPNKVYQALAAGRPVITADSPALRDAFTPGEHLLAVPPGDADALAQAVLRLALDADLRHNLANQGREYMQNTCTETILGRRLLDVIS